jgi:NAD(P)-dependent dehydrogenase (short-subunit alcohol dehydrogenase family)
MLVCVMLLSRFGKYSIRPAVNQCDSVRSQVAEVRSQELGVSIKVQYGQWFFVVRRSSFVVRPSSFVSRRSFYVLRFTSSFITRKDHHTMGQFDDKVALVTGAASGIGRATALAFAREGARVVVADVNVDGGAQTVQQIADGGGAAIFVNANVAQAAQVAAMVQAAIDTYGRLDYAFNNAGVGGPPNPTADWSEEDWNRVISVNLTGVWLCMKHEIPHILKQGGAIVNTASVAGLLGFPMYSAYSAGKHGVLGLTKTAALEYGRMGVRINAICPGWIKTPIISPVLDDLQLTASITAMQPMGRMGEPEEIAAAVVWLCSDAASFAGGMGMVLDGGLSVQ